jgi:hypothetical protein
MQDSPNASFPTEIDIEALDEFLSSDTAPKGSTLLSDMGGEQTLAAPVANDRNSDFAVVQSMDVEALKSRLFANVA